MYTCQVQYISHRMTVSGDKLCVLFTSAFSTLKRDCGGGNKFKAICEGRS